MVKLQLDCVSATTVDNLCVIGLEQIWSRASLERIWALPPGFFVKNVYTKEILVACSNERSKQKFGAEGTKDVLVSLCRRKWQSELE